MITVNYQQMGMKEPWENFVLMSSSPRRKELLHFLNPTIRTIDLDERAIEEKYMRLFHHENFLTRAAKTCCEISKAKLDIKMEDATLYIAADTIVIVDEQIYNKPDDIDEALKMFKSYFGRKHQVVTSVCLKSQHYMDVFYTVTEVEFVELYDELEPVIARYIKEKSPLDKSGAYGIQELDPRFVAGIYGDIHTVIGMPVAEVSWRIFGK